MKQPRPIKISDEVAGRCAGPDQFAKFNALIGKVMSVPRAEILRREAEYKKQSALNQHRRGPKPKASVSRAPDASLPA